MMFSDDGGLGLLIPSIHLYTFPPIHNLSYTGRMINPDTESDLIHKRIANVECPKCLVLDNFYNTDSKTSAFDRVYCAGNQPPEQEYSDILGRTHKHTVACAGVYEAHFHVKCKVCDFIFLLSTPKVNKEHGPCSNS